MKPMRIIILQLEIEAVLLPGIPPSAIVNILRIEFKYINIYK